MKRHRMGFLVASALGLAALNWFDPWRPEANRDGDTLVGVAMPIEPASRPVSRITADSSMALAQQQLGRNDVPLNPKANLFASRSEVMAEAQAAALAAAQKAERRLRRTPPSPIVMEVANPEPEESPPPVRVLGTWLEGGVWSAFLATSNGTTMIAHSSVVLGRYQVHILDGKQIALRDTQSQRIWTWSASAALSASGWQRELKQ